MQSFFDKVEEKMKEYNMQDNIFSPPLSDRESMQLLTDYLLGEEWYSMNPISQEQINTEIVYEILSKYSRKFRKEKRERIKRKK